MTQNPQTVFSQLNSYLSEFAGSGFSKSRAEEVLSLLDREDASPLGRVFITFGCNSFEKAAVALGLLTAVCTEASENAVKLCGSVTPSLVAALFFGTGDVAPFADSLQEYSPLGRLFMNVAPRCDAPMRLRDFAVEYALNGTLYDDCFLPLDAEEKEVVPLKSQQNAEQELISYLEKYDITQPFVLRLTGQTGSGRHTCVKNALRKLGMRYLTVCLTDDIGSEAIGELSSKLLLFGGIPVVSAPKTSPKFSVQLKRLADEVGFVIAISESAEQFELSGVDTASVRLGDLSLRENYLLWQNLGGKYPLADSVDFSELSGEFEMTAGAVEKALRSASVLSGGDKLTLADIKNGCYRSFDADLGDKAVKIDCVFSWDDIVLPAQSKRLLQDACQQVRLRHRVFDSWGFARKMPYGKGVSMIFTGPPGTGKTMAAQVMAAELGMEIYKVSLANVVSKYIGETEKNLNEIFNKAKLCRCILFFDEADVLFSKRTEVREANDKYSNMESAFLLQKIEEFSGVVILATNLVQNFDEAFKRRMRFIIDFPFPDAIRRRELWQKAFPAQAPTGYIDYDFLVERFELSGSNIRNIALHSAFLAAAENGAIGMKHIMEAIRNEYAKSGKAFTRAEAGEYYSELE